MSPTLRRIAQREGGFVSVMTSFGESTITLSARPSVQRVFYSSLVLLCNVSLTPTDFLFG